MHRFFQVSVHGIGSHFWLHLAVWENKVEGDLCRSVGRMKLKEICAGLLRLFRVAQVHPEVVPRNRAGVWERN